MNLEETKINKVITQQDVNGEIIAKNEDILNEQKHFYQNIYTEKLNKNVLFRK